MINQMSACSNQLWEEKHCSSQQSLKRLRVLMCTTNVPMMHMNLFFFTIIFKSFNTKINLNQVDVHSFMPCLILFFTFLPVPGLECVAGSFEEVAVHDYTIWSVHIELQLGVIIGKVLWKEHKDAWDQWFRFCCAIKLSMSPNRPVLSVRTLAR